MDRLSLNICASPKPKWEQTLRQYPFRARRAVQIMQKYKPSSAKLLDTGCSDGSILMYLREHFPDCYGVDIDIKSLEVARWRGLNCYYVPHFFPFIRETFDIVNCDVTIEHVKNTKHFLSEIKRVMKKDGILYITTANKWWIVEPHYYLPFLSYLPKRWANKYLRLFGIDATYDSINLPSYGEFKKMLTDAGFAIFDWTVYLIKDKEYGLEKERGFPVLIARVVIQICRTLKLRWVIKLMLWCSLGWVFVAVKDD